MNEWAGYVLPGQRKAPFNRRRSHTQYVNLGRQLNVDFQSSANFLAQWRYMPANPSVNFRYSVEGVNVRKRQLLLVQVLVNQALFLGSLTVPRQSQECLRVLHRRRPTI